MFERSHGKTRPSLPRASDLQAGEAADKPTAARDVHGHFAPGNRTGVAARFTATVKKALGGDANSAETRIVTRDAKRVMAHVLRAMPSDAAPVRVLVAVHARHLALNAYYTAKAEAAGLDTPTGLKLLEVADRQSQRAERTLVTALDTARVCAAQDAKKRLPAFLVGRRPCGRAQRQRRARNGHRRGNRRGRVKRRPPFSTFLGATGFTPTPPQARMVTVAFDGAASEGDELGLALFGAEVATETHDVVAIVKGARIGGSLLSAYRLLHLALTVDLPTLAPGEHAFGVIAAPDLRLARQSLRYVAGALASPALAGFLVSDGTDAVTVKRPDDKRVTIEALPATRGGSAVRGRTLVGAVMSEAAFFRDENYSVNDGEVFRALAPRIVPGGQLILESTPWAEAGLLYELFTEHHGKPGRTLAVHAPTLLMRPSPKMVALVEAERKRDPDNAAREFDAAFMTAGSGVFFDPVALDDCVDGSIELGIPRKGVAHAGADWAFESDSSALAIADATHVDGQTQVAIVELQELTPTRGEPLKTAEVVKTFAEATSRYHARSIMADAHYRVAIQEHLEKHGMVLEDAPAGRPGKVQTYIRLRELVNAKRIRLPPHDRLLAQLKAIVSKPVPGGGIAISSPRRGRGGHGDIASAVVLAAWCASGAEGSGADYSALVKKFPHGF